MQHEWQLRQKASMWPHLLFTMPCRQEWFTNVHHGFGFTFRSSIILNHFDIYTVYIYIHTHTHIFTLSENVFQKHLHLKDTKTCKKQVSARNVQSLVVPGKGSKPLADFRWAETFLLKPRRVHCSHTCQVRISPFRELLGDWLGNSVETQNQYEEICEKNSELHQMKMFSKRRIKSGLLKDKVWLNIFWKCETFMFRIIFAKVLGTLSSWIRVRGATSRLKGLAGLPV